MPRPLQRRLFLFLFLLVLVAGALFAHWFLVGRHFEHTDNAYVQGEITRISSQLAAKIERVYVEDNQQVQAGDLLLRLEDQDFRLALARAQANLATHEAELAQARSQLARQDSLIAASEAGVIASKATQERSQADLMRVQALRKPGYVSEERVASLTADARIARSQTARAEADLKAQRQQVEALQAEIARLEAQLLSARAEIEQAQLNLTRTEIHAPASGVIGQRSARIGQYIQPGAHLMAIVPTRDIWVQANFKETQIGRMQRGSPPS